MPSIIPVLRLILLSLIIFISLHGNASHVVRGSIKYSYLGPGKTAGTSQYKIRVGVIRDCNGIGYTRTTEDVTIYCTQSNSSFNVKARRINYQAKPGERATIHGARDVSDVCRSKASRCAGAGNPGGYEEHIFEAIVELTPCNSWQIWINGISRQFFSNCWGGVASHDASINTWDFPKNSAPDFADHLKPITNYCVGQNVQYGIGTIDPDGDSLVFRLVKANTRRTGPYNITYVSYTNGASFLNPIPNSNFQLESKTGLISFKPKSTGRYLVAFEVIEYDRCSSKEKGRSYREVQFEIMTCTNIVPTDISGISKLKGKAKQLGRYSLEVCEGEHISWVDTIKDQNLNDTLYFRSNVVSVLNGVKWKIIPLQRNLAAVKFEWKASAGQNNLKVFYLEFDDDRCDYPGTGYSVFRIKVNGAAYAGEDQKICKGDTAYLHAKGAQQYNWRVISGDQIKPGVNWFPDTTAKDTGAYIKFIPTQKTTFELTVPRVVDACGRILYASCGLKDTITIYSVDSFSIKASPDVFVCNPGSGNLSVVASRPFTYSYKWNKANYLDTDSISNPSFSGIKSPEQFWVTVTSNDGCERRDYIDVHVSKPFPQNMKAMASDTLICITKQIDLWVDKGTVDYASCDTGGYECQGVFKQFYSGKGGNLNDANPNLSRAFAGTYNTANVGQKNQYLYLASHLKKMGLRAGPINSIGFQIDSLYKGRTNTINGYTVRIGCTQESTLPASRFLSGTIQVFSERIVIPKKGWNDHLFDSPYSWDGTSNLFVEICWDNATWPDSGSHQQTFDKMSYPAATSYYRPSISTFFNDACGNATVSPGFPNSYLPRTRFNACAGIRSSRFSFNWEPKRNGSFIGSTAKDSVKVNANLSSAKQYVVYVQDSAYGVCFDTLAVDVSVVSSYNTKPFKLPPQCIRERFITLKPPTPPKITNPGGKWYGKGFVNDSTGIWDPLKSGIGKFWVTYEVTGDACASIDSTQIEIVGNPDPTVLTADSFCQNYGAITIDSSHWLNPLIPGGTLSGYGVDSMSTQTGMIYWIDGTKFSPTIVTPDTAVIKHTITVGCTHDTTYAIPVVSEWDHRFLGVEHHGKAYLTDQFCTTDKVDTLRIAGENAIWRIHSNAQVMVDPYLGIINPSSINTNEHLDIIDSITVGNYGWCGSDTTFPIHFIIPPEIEVLDKIYCKDFIKLNPNKIDSVLIRIPVGSVSPSYKKLGYGRDTIVTYASIPSTHWSNIYAGANQYDYHQWVPNGWISTKNIARYQLKSIPNGRTPIVYKLAFNVRNIGPAPNSDLCYSLDTGYIELRNSLDINLPFYHEMCDKRTALLEPRQIKKANYQWSDGSNASSLLVKSPGTYKVTVTTDGCIDSALTHVEWCTSIEENLANGYTLRVFPNPASSTVTVQLEGYLQYDATIQVMNLTGQIVRNHTVTERELLNGFQFNVENLKSGVYLLYLNSGPNSATYRLVIK